MSGDESQYVVLVIGSEIAPANVRETVGYNIPNDNLRDEIFNMLQILPKTWSHRSFRRYDNRLQNVLHSGISSSRL
jgi:hypothetical protein